MATCRVYAHLLLVMDDSEFHGADGILNPGQQRAVATAFNTLVFRTHCPARSPEPHRPPQPAAAMLAEWAPVLLRCAMSQMTVPKVSHPTLAQACTAIDLSMPVTDHVSRTKAGRLMAALRHAAATHS